VKGIDRAETLRNAEKLLRQGKLEPAIAEYIRIVEEYPRDWNTANSLGDLYARAGQVNKAVEQFIRIADSLNSEGFLPKAAALYKKTLKLAPDHEHALLQAAEIAAGQGLLADARTYLGAVEEKRRARGDAFGAAQSRIRLGTLDPADYESRKLAAAARIEIGDIAAAIRDLKEIARELSGKARAADAIAALAQAAEVAPGDDEVRRQLIETHISIEDFAQARARAATTGELKWVADALDLRGRADEAIEIRCDAARLDPDDLELQANLARAFVERGDMARAAQYLTIESAGADPQLLLTVAEMRLRSGKTDEGVAIARQLLDQEPGLRDTIARLGAAVAEHAPESGFQTVLIVVDACAARREWTAAQAALEPFVARVPNHIPALMRLVEISVDGSLESPLNRAQALLTDAYLVSGMASEARFIAEDLLAREPSDPANVERLRRALVLMNERDPDTLIAERLSGQSPFGSTDLNAADFPPFEEDSGLPSGLVAQESTASASTASPSTASALPPALSPLPSAQSTLTAPGFTDIGSLQSLLDELEPRTSPLPTAHARSESVEVDLSIVLKDLERPMAAPQPQVVQAPAPPPPPAPAPAPDLDEVFEQLRGEATRKAAIDAAARDYERALQLRAAGDFDGCIEALQAASRAPMLRFVTASLLGRIYKQRGQLAQAIDWFERASQAPAPTPAEYHELLFELGEGLEAAGETTRALDVCLELQADAGSYRDIDERVDRLAKVQAGG
jgi:tetratricopeptide (TPR) repeat protein